MAPVGTLEILVEDEAACIVRWTIDDFLRRKEYRYFSDDFRFASASFFLLTSRGNCPKYFIEFSPSYPFSKLPGPYSWKLSAEGSDGRILLGREGVTKSLCNVVLDLPEDVERVLRTDGSLVMLCELRRIPEETADTPSPTLQHPGKIRVGTLEILVEDEAMCIVRWTIHDFLRLDENLYYCSDDFRFASASFFLRRNTGTYHRRVVEFSPRYPFSKLPGPYSWKLSAEGSDGRILLGTEGVTKSLCKVVLRLPHAVYRVLRTNGSLVMLCELRRIPEENADASSPTLQHPVKDVVKQSALPVKNRNAADDVRKSSVLESIKREHLAHPSTGTFGSLQLQEQAVLYTWIVPNYREHAERETWLYSDSFQFASSLWQLRLFHDFETGRESNIFLSLELISKIKSTCYYPFRWGLWAEDALGQTLQMRQGSSIEWDDALGVNLNLGLLWDAHRLLHSDGVLRVSCDLHIDILKNCRK